jgi:hypothetical protein
LSPKNTRSIWAFWGQSFETIIEFCENLEGVRAKNEIGENLKERDVFLQKGGSFYERGEFFCGKWREFVWKNGIFVEKRSFCGKNDAFWEKSFVKNGTNSKNDNIFKT